MRRYLMGLLIALVSVAFLSPARAGRKKKSQVIQKIFRSKKRFLRVDKKKKERLWVKIATVKARNKLMAETLGKRIPILCRLSTSNNFECEGRTPKGIAFVTESAQWPAGRMKLKIIVQSRGISIELSNKWKKYIRTKRKR